MEFITAFLNNAANDDDIRNGTEYAGRVGIQVTMPKWGISRSDFVGDPERKIIAKGLSSVKFISGSVAEELYQIAHKRTYDRFIDVLEALNGESSLNSHQLDILIKLDFFSDFGNQRELLRITDLFTNLFKSGEVRKLARDRVDGTPLEPIVQKYAVGTTKAGGVAKAYTMLDVESVMRETEDAVKAVGMEDLPLLTKVHNFSEIMGYAGYTTGREEDRRKLYVSDVYPLVRKKDGKQFGYSIVTKSIGSGKDARFTVFNKVYEPDPIHKGDIVYCKSFERDGIYFRLTDYEKIV